MKLLVVYCIVVACCVSSCIKRNDNLVQRLISAEQGWRIQSVLVNSGDSSDELNNDILSHYSDVGTLIFSDESNGIYTYQDTIYSFTWSVSNRNLSLEIEDLQIYDSPFIYYYFSGREQNPYTNFSNDLLRNFNMFEYNNFTIKLTNRAEGFSNTYQFGDLEILITKETN